MNIIIQRKEQTKSAIAGTLHIDGQYICDTAENRHTALPAGTYQIVRHFCKQYNRFMPLIRHPELVSGPVKELVSGSVKELVSGPVKELVSGSKNHQWDCSLLTARCEGCSPQKTEDKEVSLNTIMPCYCPMLKPGNGVHHREDGSIILELHIAVDAGVNITAICSSIIHQIRYQVERTTGVKVRDVRIFVEAVKA